MAAALLALALLEAAVTVASEGGGEAASSSTMSRCEAAAPPRVREVFDVAATDDSIRDASCGIAAAAASNDWDGSSRRASESPCSCDGQQHRIKHRKMRRSVPITERVLGELSGSA